MSDRATTTRVDANDYFTNLMPEELRAWVADNLPPPPPAIPLADLVRPPSVGDDPDELIRHRFLCRGGTMLLVGPTGAGKSSLSMQLALCFAAGAPCLGIEPARPMRVLIVQAENDAGDLAEMRDGVLKGLAEALPAPQEALRRVFVATVDDKTGEAFAALLGALCAEYAPDLVFMDPAFAYLGGDASAQKEVSPFLRNQVLPVVHRHNIGLVIVHHANKPPAGGQQKAGYMPGDYAYLGAGSAEWANVCRGVLALRATEDPRVYELRAAKRGFRLRWREGGREDGETVTVKHVAYDRKEGVICWHEATADQIPQDAQDRGQKIIDAIAGGHRTHGAIAKATGISKASLSETWLPKLIRANKVVQGSDNEYRLTGKAVPNAQVEDLED